MAHTYEVLVDIRESSAPSTNAFRCGTTRYEIDAESKALADNMALAQAKSEHPQGCEYDVRVTRLLK
ncbi:MULTISPECIES: hypothetical protein [Oscillatoriophycideae]|uniref:Uncharacterized protein n=1 Tax=Aerosakkonema funiforme FACHB-1375 TaxID=2949571 RepID=A0A926VAZ0_9CYAN|nr:MULTISPECIES: hypothetical protein [Oscillatoriales]MBD2180529.1 hypothetical protein [Aerosakkonema funiforme FACHB-1375]MBD3563100.1 hypothetical protein [Planktothrix sp. FACHB-1355]